MQKYKKKRKNRIKLSVKKREFGKKVKLKMILFCKTVFLFAQLIDCE